MLIVIAMIGIIVTFVIPRAHGVKHRANLRAALDQVATALSIARASAIQKGTPSEFRTDGERVQVTLVGTNQAILSPRDLNDLYGAEIAAIPEGQNAVQYDARGIASNPGTVKYAVTVNGLSDTVCVSRMGLVHKKRCF